MFARTFDKKSLPHIAGSLYPEPESNRHGLLHWCLMIDKPSASHR